MKAARPTYVLPPARPTGRAQAGPNVGPAPGTARGGVAAFVRAAAAVALAGAASAAAAQTAVAEPSEAMRCLTPGVDARRPDYPFVEFKKRHTGRVVVDLEFAGATLAPKVDVVEADGTDGADAFEREVRRKVATWRVPCLEPRHAPARMRFEFVFRADEPLARVSLPSDERAAQRAACIAHVDGPESKPAYPMSARRQELSGRVVARAEFTAPGQPPTFQVYALPGMQVLASSVSAWLAGLRMPCQDGSPFVQRWVMDFVMEGDARGFRPGLSFIDLLRAVDGLDRQRVDFDFRTMGCPFDVELQYTQPLLPNQVRVGGASDGMRQPFLDWLSTWRLVGDAQRQRQMFGDSVRFQVPCVVLNLKPQESPS